MTKELLLTDAAASWSAQAEQIARICAGLNADDENWRFAARNLLRKAFPEWKFIVHVGGCHIAVHEKSPGYLDTIAAGQEWHHGRSDRAYGALIARVLEVPTDARSRARRYELGRGGKPVAGFNTVAWALVPAGFWTGGQNA